MALVLKVGGWADIVGQKHANEALMPWRIVGPGPGGRELT